MTDAADRPPSEEETDADTEAEADPRDATTDHLSDVEEGAGCTEIWEHLSEQRERAGDD
jgi:hypothetical protein